MEETWLAFVDFLSFLALLSGLDYPVNGAAIEGPTPFRSTSLTSKSTGIVLAVVCCPGCDKTRIMSVHLSPIFVFNKRPAQRRSLSSLRCSSLSFIDALSRVLVTLG